jgi:hypothetical protein
MEKTKWDLTTDEEAAEVSDETLTALEKCIKLCVPIVEQNVKFPSNLERMRMETHDQSTARTATKTTRSSKFA